MSGGINIYASRRANYARCKWWRISEENSSDPVRDLEHMGTPSGVFYAKPVTSRYDSENEVAQAFMFDKSDITLITSDNVAGLEPHCAVQYLDKVWLVSDVQKKPMLKTTEYGKGDFLTYIKLNG